LARSGSPAAVHSDAVIARPPSPILEEADMKSRALTFTGISAVLLALLALGCAKTGGGASEIVIGEYGSLTGNDATFGQSTKAGVEVALNELAQQPGQGKIGGLAVRAVVEDDQGKSDEAATVVQKLINQDQVVAVIGEVASSRSIAAAPICQQAGVPMISPSSTNPKVTQIGDFIFRMCFLDDFQGQTMARFAIDLKKTKVAILKDVKSDYSVGLSQYFTEAFTKLGGTIVVEQAYAAGDQDFSAQLTAIKAKHPDAIFIPGYYTEVGLIARKARELGITVPLLGGDGWESEKLIEIGGEAMNGAYYSNHWALDSPDPHLQEFLKTYRTTFKSDPDAIAGLAYDAAKVLFASMEKLATDDPATFQGLASSKAGTPERKAATKKLRDLIAATANYPGVTGTITLDANRNASKPAVVIEVKDGKKVYNTTINPS
jgi:branched-chain amino acid transport system substrate-binding protein